MGLWQGFKSIFVGEDVIEQEEYAAYQKPEERETTSEYSSEAYSERKNRANNFSERQINTEQEQRHSKITYSNADVGMKSYEKPSYERQYSRNVSKNNTASIKSSDNNTNRMGDVKMTITDESSFDLVLARPKNYKDVKEIGKDLNLGKIVILNLENVSTEEATRILDFLSGVAYANEDQIKVLSTKTYGIMPKFINFDGVNLVDELENNGYEF